MASTRVAVLLRGVNVGRAKRISMSDFAGLLTGLGASDVTTLLNSGNAVCTLTGRHDRFASAVGDAVTEQLGFSCDVVVRTKAEIEAVVARDPLGATSTNPSWYLVHFLGAAPASAQLAAFSALDLSPDVWVLDGRELYVWMPDAVNASPVGKALQKGVLGVVWTGRNWTTVTRLRDLF